MQFHPVPPASLLAPCTPGSATTDRSRVASRLPLEGPAHAARTSLTARSGALALLGAGLGGELPAGAGALLAIARRNCALLERVLEQQYAADRADSGIP